MWEIIIFFVVYKLYLLVNVVVTSEACISTLVFIFNLGVPNLDVFGYVQRESNRTLFKIFIIFNVVNILIGNITSIRFYFDIS